MGVFLYGTLLYPPLFALVSGSAAGRFTPARLPGHAVETAPDGPWPALVERPGAEARGMLATGLTGDQLRRLDAYELPFGYVRVETRVMTGEGPAAATFYRPPAGQAATGRDWSLDRWIAAQAEEALLAAGEIDWGAADAGTIRRQWPMVRVRAAATMRARADRRPATLRHAVAPADWAMRPAGPPAGDFFRFGAHLVDHRRFDGGFYRDLAREVLVGADAALVLPYDPGRDRVLLVEQFRPGPARRGDANPWTLEPVAGIVDAGETPEEAARRETAEEARIATIDLRHMFSAYSSPGNATDHFHCYLGLADLPDGHATAGGIADEAEDLRLHVIGFDRAMDLLATGEMTALPLVAMMLWLARERDGLRDGAAGGRP